MLRLVQKNQSIKYIIKKQTLIPFDGLKIKTFAYFDQKL